MSHAPLLSRSGRTSLLRTVLFRALLLRTVLLLCAATSAIAAEDATVPDAGTDEATHETAGAAIAGNTRLALAANVLPATGSLFASLTVSQHGLDTDRGPLADDSQSAFGLGFRYTDRLAVELTGGRTETSLGVSPVDIDTLRLDSLWFFDPAGGWQPWFAAGVTDQRLKSGGTDARETLLGAGMGVFRHLGGPFGLRLQWRTGWSLDEEDWDHLTGIGLTVAFGGERHLSP